MGLLSRDQILKAQDLKFEDVPCPEWGGDVRIASLTAQGRALFMKRAAEQREALEATAKKKGAPVDPELKAKVDFDIEMLLLALSAIDKNNHLIFKLEDVQELGAKSAEPVTRCAEVALRLAGLGVQSQVEAVKNSEPTSSDASSSA